MDDIEIKDLRYMSAIARHEGISKAADELYISQPALSGYLKNLETRLGVPLFQRIGKRMVPVSYTHLPLVLAEIPVSRPWEIFAWLPFGGWNECPDLSLIHI